MSRWKARLLALITAVAMLLAVTGPAAMADSFDDCEFIGFDDNGEALFVCEGDFDDDDFDDDDFDEFVVFEDCLGAEIGDECFGIEEEVEVFFF